MNSDERNRCSHRLGFPIRKSPDRRLLASSRSLSQLTTSFIASLRQGIHTHALSSLTIKSISNTKLSEPRQTARSLFELRCQFLRCSLPAGRQRRFQRAAILVVSIARQNIRFSKNKTSSTSKEAENQSLRISYSAPCGGESPSISQLPSGQQQLKA